MQENPRRDTCYSYPGKLEANNRSARSLARVDLMAFSSTISLTMPFWSLRLVVLIRVYTTPALIISSILAISSGGLTCVGHQ